jgi:hypothetical protein
MIDDRDLEALARELPSLAVLRRFAGSLSRLPWFANLGEPLTPGARAAGRLYLEGLGFPDADIALLADWEDAAGAAESLDWNSPSWEQEESLRADLTDRALGFLSEEALSIAMAMIAAEIAEPARESFEEAAALADLESDALEKLAVGAATQGAHQAALALLAAADPDFDAANHPFTAKFRLFEFGRWPVSVAGGSFNLF